jgi:hypothetical protein
MVWVCLALTVGQMASARWLGRACRNHATRAGSTRERAQRLHHEVPAYIAAIGLKFCHPVSQSPTRNTSPICRPRVSNARCPSTAGRFLVGHGSARSALRSSRGSSEQLPIRLLGTVLNGMRDEGGYPHHAYSDWDLSEDEVRVPATAWRGAWRSPLHSARRPSARTRGT